ncbi:hypothetical protein ABEB36_006940 [Hypothenemus hampei]|uniref:Origin recognition complex subunit 6 n=1 Tax=Hypothenemus hampei TaxID=57062 RepID=A0ABD1ESA1_HYPHA
MDKHLLKTTAQRLNIHDDSVLNKIEEFLRLYQSKSSLKTLNDQTKIVLCTDLASQHLGKAFDKETALALSGLKKSTYHNQLNTLEKILGLDRTLSISDVCIQLGCTAIKDLAKDYLEKFRNLGKDLDHPQYVAAAIYFACKSKKIALDKQKLISISRLRPSQWKELLSSFEKLGINHVNENQRGRSEVILDETLNMDCDNKEKTCDQNVPVEFEEYEVWKKRILEEANEALKIIK